MTKTQPNGSAIYHPIFGMPLRTLFLAFVCTFAPWAVPLCMPISGARPPYEQMIMWVAVWFSKRPGWTVKTTFPGSN